MASVTPNPGTWAETCTGTRHNNERIQMKIGDSIKVKDQEIYGKIIYDYGNAVVIEDEHAETEDDQLYFKKSEIKLNK